MVYCKVKEAATILPRVNYEEFARRAFAVQELPMGDLPVYDKDATKGHKE